MKLKLNKFVVHTVFLELDEQTGEVLGERLSEPSYLYGVDALRNYPAEVSKYLMEVNENASVG